MLSSCINDWVSIEYSLFPVLVMKGGVNCVYFVLCEDVFVAKSGLNSNGVRQLLPCRSFQPAHYSSLSFHIV